MADDLLTLTDANFETEVLGSDTPVLVDFWAQWCQPCVAMAPDLEAVAGTYSGRLRVGKLNVEENDGTPNRFNVTSLPTLLVFKGGKVADQRVGRLSRDAIVKMVEPHLG